MASKARKRALPAAIMVKPVSKKAKNSRKDEELVDEQPVITPKKRKTLGMKTLPTRVSPRRACQKDAEPASKSKSKPQAKKSVPVKKRGRRKKVIEVEEDSESEAAGEDVEEKVGDEDVDEDVEEVSQASNEGETATQKVLKFKQKVREILLQGGPRSSNAEEEEQENPDDLLSRDSDDDVCAAEQSQNAQDTMDGNQSYHKHPILDSKDYCQSENVFDDDDDDEANDDLNASKMTMVPDEVDYDDDNKDLEEWWTEDPTRELTLCALWEDADCLYDMNAEGYRITGTKDVVLRKFATVLHIPREYIFKKKIVSMNE